MNGSQAVFIVRMRSRISCCALRVYGKAGQLPVQCLGQPQIEDLDARDQHHVETDERVRFNAEKMQIKRDESNLEQRSPALPDQIGDDVGFDAAHCWIAASRKSGFDRSAASS